MGFKVSSLWERPVLNPVNKKARSVPMLNPIDPHGHLNLTKEQVANSNIISLVATLAVRFIAGPLCDQIGSRRVFSLVLLAGSIPIGLAPLIKDATGLYIIRFFIGILGGSFVPCQVWCTGWFDKNVVGTANALSGGWGNAGGGITYFIMPAVYDSLKHRWGQSSVLPRDDRHLHVQENLQQHGLPGEIVAVTGTVTSQPPTFSASPSSDEEKGDKLSSSERNSTSAFDNEASLSKTEAIETAQGETIAKPTAKEALAVCCSLHGLFHVATYACSFGGELAIDSILASYYLKNFPSLGQTNASNLTAIFGFLNFITRPLGGVMGDLLYNYCGKSLWLKKIWIHVCGLLTGALLTVIGMLDSHHLPTMVGLIVVMAVFHEAGNGANFALVPHVYPYANGILSGLTGAGGNLGGVVFAVIFRFMDGGTNYAKAFWVIGVDIDEDSNYTTGEYSFQGSPQSRPTIPGYAARLPLSALPFTVSPTYATARNHRNDLSISSYNISKPQHRHTTSVEPIQVNDHIKLTLYTPQDFEVIISNPSDIQPSPSTVLNPAP
ncbi:putative nitrate transporter [Triangularia verruculosa]|uniref:Nitrate transporter n=1 Tax=Triangularia verruculosa TaxID=2587418 RepID=A0AAN6XHT1_9PEZI|nr:putative nitrate transporter [Triangularia verruculosa]